MVNRWIGGPGTDRPPMVGVKQRKSELAVFHVL
jgi:hypothetical protein